MVDYSSPTPPALEPRFLMPDGWRWHIFTNPEGRKLRFGTVAPANRIPDAVVIGLQGLGEFTEKYFETARTLLGRNLSFWMMDWQGQGRSDRHLKNPHKRHSAGFENDVADLHCFIMEYVKHSAVHPDVGRIPLVMLGHSMGANIGLRYLHQHPDMFACAAFTAPLFGIQALKVLPASFSTDVTAVMQEILSQSYVEFGGGDWKPSQRDKKNIYSGDPVRSAVHNAWCRHDPALRVGNVTYGWLHAANQSCRFVQQPEVMKAVATPALFAIPGHEKLVDNAVARRAVAAMPNAKILELEDAWHEILMERDELRDRFFNAFYELLQVNHIKEKLKPF